MPEPVIPVTLPMAKQETFKLGEYELPGLAFNDKGEITLPSMLDLMFVSLAALDNPEVNQILKANKIVIRTVDGQLYFPRPDTR